MKGSVLSFLKAEWKVSDTGSAHWASSFLYDIVLHTGKKLFYLFNRCCLAHLVVKTLWVIFIPWLCHRCQWQQYLLCRNYFVKWTQSLQDCSFSEPHQNFVWIWNVQWPQEPIMQFDWLRIKTLLLKNCSNCLKRYTTMNTRLFTMVSQLLNTDDYDELEGRYEPIKLDYLSTFFIEVPLIPS
jgi:hypothetical protein